MWTRTPPSASGPRRSTQRDGRRARVIDWHNHAPGDVLLYEVTVGNPYVVEFDDDDQSECLDATLPAFVLGIFPNEIDDELRAKKAYPSDLSTLFHKYDNVLFAACNPPCYAVVGRASICHEKAHTRLASPSKNGKN
jgi:hypothetical protein